MIKKVKQYLKNINATHPKYEAKQIIKKLVDHPDLTKTEQWLIYYTYAEERLVANTCDKLGLSEAQFYIEQKTGLIKLYYIYLA